MSNETDPLAGFYEKMRSIDSGQLMSSLPVGLISLSALRKTKLALAKRLFHEAYVSPLRRLLQEGQTEEGKASIDDIEARFAQDDLLHLGQDIELLASAHLLHRRYHGLHGISGVPIVNEEGDLTTHGEMFFRGMVKDVSQDVMLFMIFCERRVTMLLTAALAGAEAMEDQLAFHREGYRAAYMASIEQMLRGNSLNGKYLRRAMDYIATRSDEDIFTVWCGFMCTWCWSRKETEQRLRQLLKVRDRPDDDIPF